MTHGKGRPFHAIAQERQRVFRKWGRTPSHSSPLFVRLSVCLPLCLKRTDSIQTLCGRSGCSSSRWLASGQMPAGQTQFHSLATPYEAASMIHIFVSNIITNNNHLKSIHPTLNAVVWIYDVLWLAGIPCNQLCRMTLRSRRICAAMCEIALTRLSIMRNVFGTFTRTLCRSVYFELTPQMLRVCVLWLMWKSIYGIALRASRIYQDGKIS